MSVWSTLTASTALPADLVTAIGVAAAGVYTGRRPQNVPRKDLEVWLARGEVEELSRGLGNTVTRHRIRVAVRVRTNAGGNGTGSAQLTTVEAHLRTIVDRYRGRRPAFAVTAVSDLIALDAREGSVDTAPDDGDTLEGVVDLDALVR